MSSFKRMVTLYSLPIILTWLIATVFIDIFAVPNVFRNVSSVSEAGKVGLSVFSNFNKFELIFGIFLSLGIFFQKNSFKLFTWMLISFFVFWPVLYIFKMTPGISEASQLMNSVLKTDPQYLVYKEGHAYYHNLYKTLDTIKILVLFLTLIFVSILNFKERK